MIKRKRKIKRRRAAAALLAALAAVLMLTYALTAEAASPKGTDTGSESGLSDGTDPDTQKRGAIEIRYLRDIDGKVPIRGAVFALCYLASVTEEGRYRLLFDLSALDKSWVKGAVIEGGQLQEVDRERLASVLPLTSENTSDDGLVKRAATNESGSAGFEELPAGLYLCAEIKPSEGFERSVPILLPVPSDSAAGWAGREAVTIINPKPVTSEKAEEPPVRPVVRQSAAGGSGARAASVVKTGDMAATALWMALTGLALMAGTAAAASLRRRPGKEAG